MVQKPADSDLEAIGQPGQKDAPTKTGLLMLGALGVVYGDIGTSPIYAFREALLAAAGAEVAEARGYPGRAVADRLGADDYRHHQIRHLRAARRQPGRGRHAVADGAGPQTAFRQALGR